MSSTAPASSTASTFPTLPKPRLSSVAFFDPEHGDGAFTLAGKSPCGLTVAKTSDGGASFIRTAVVHPAWACGSEPGPSVAFDDQGDGFLYGPGLEVTHDGGHTWVAQSTSAAVVSVAALGRSVWMVQVTCHASGSGETCPPLLSESQDGGRSWQPIMLPPVPLPPNTSDIGLVGAANGQTWLVRTTAEDGYVVGQPASAEKGGPDQAPLWHTTDGGRDWSVEDVPCEGGLSVAISAAPNGELWAVCGGEPGAGNQEKSVLVSHDEGAHWQVRACGHPSCSPEGEYSISLPTGGYVGEIDATSSTTAFLVGYRNTVLVSRDGGSSWTPVALPAGTEVDGTEQVMFFDRDHGLVTGEDDAVGTTVIWSTPDAGQDWATTVPRLLAG